MSHAKLRIVIATGGTGGHIFPAISLADALKDDNEANEVLFVGTSDHMEAIEIPRAGYPFRTIQAKGFSGPIALQIRAVTMMLQSVGEAKRILSEYQPDVVVGFGGYVSASVVIAARKLNIPVILHEQNSYAGRANLFLERYASAVVVCYKETIKQFKKAPVYLLGNPRTYALRSSDPSLEILKAYRLNATQSIIMFVMGSQGSDSINQIMLKTLSMLAGKPYQVLYVTGRKHYDSFNKMAPVAENIKIIPYVNQTAMLRHTTLLITRGGATTAAEMCAFGVPGIIVPSPYVPNNHQEHNAQALVKENAAWMIREKQLSPQLVLDKIEKIIGNNAQLSEMATNAKRIGFPNAAQDLIALIRKVR